MLRVRVGMTQTQVGEAVGLSYQQIQSYENGSDRLSSSIVPKLCAALQCDPNTLFNHVGADPIPVLSKKALEIAFKLDRVPPRVLDRVHKLVIEAVSQPQHQNET